MTLEVFDDMQQVSAEAVARLLPCVSEQRRTEALRYKHVQGQFACLKSYAMLHTLLVDKGVIAKDHYPEFIRNEHGKPMLVGFPEIHFNISHCKDAIAVAIDTKPIGIDIESIRQPSPALLSYTMSEAEIVEINQSPNPDQSFTMLWTKKEALFKYMSTGICGDIPHLLDSIPPQVSLHTQLHEDKQYALTIAMEGACC